MVALTHYQAGDRVRAEQAIERALGAYAKAEDRTLEASALGTYGKMRQGNGDPHGAIDLFSRAYPALHDARSAEEAGVLSAWAEAQVTIGETASALEKLDRALALYRLLTDRVGEAQAEYVRALALQKDGRTVEAADAASAATALVESTRGSIVNTDFRVSYFSKERSYFDLQVDLLQQHGSTAAAFEASERARARSLLDGLAGSAARIEKGVEPALLTRQRQVRTALTAKEHYRAQIVGADGENGPRVAAADREIARLIDESDSVDGEIRAKSPEYWALKAPAPIRLADVQQTLLDPWTSLVEYHLGAAHSYVWVISRASIAVHELPPSARIETLARRYHELLSRDVDGLDQAAREKLRTEIAAQGRLLAAVVWKPVENGVQSARLLIVADGALQYVPFAALPSLGGPVLAKHELVYLPSASVLQTIRRTSRPIPANVTAAVFADPVFSKNDPRMASERDSAAPARTRAADGGSYGRLRFSRREAEAIRSVLPKAFEALDFDAAKNTIETRDLRTFSILHFATHGSLNTAHPELSGLVLSLVDRGGKPVDGFLRLHDIYNLNLDADLVVLSACRTALGKEVYGEGLIGLTRGFMYAGASRVVSSVWNVDDRASALLMSRFYEQMLTGHLAPAAALRRAQLSLLAEPRWSDPHYWAAFGLQGEWK
jgi:CHAT domain-containing protein